MLTSGDPAVRHPAAAAAGGASAHGDLAVADVVSRARAAQPAWAGRTLKDRIAAIRRLRRLVADRADAIADTIRDETGKPPGDALGAEVVVTCDHLAHLCRIAPRVLRPRRARGHPFLHRRARVDYRPYGVIGAITPWNFPFTLGMGVIGTALVSGNGVVLKPSEWTPRVGRLAGALAAEAVGIDGLIGVVTGDGSTGAALVRAGVDKIAFTGSAATGRRVMAAAAESLTPLILELGGKDAMIVCGDADVERAAHGAVWAAFFGCGQVCQSIERVYVVEDVYDEFLAATIAAARRVRTSDEPDAMMGPLIAPFQIETVERQIGDARQRGARILLGGRRVQGGGLDNFFEPTVLTDVTRDMELMREETFGPVLPIQRVADEEEAIRLANDSSYGLDASVWSRDRAKARRISERLVAGTVLINDHLINYAMPDVPFGGTRASGFGRVHGAEGLREFVWPKPVIEDRLSFRREPHWFRESESGEDLARALLDLHHGRGLGRRLRGALRLARQIRR